MTVTQLSPADLEDIYDTRATLEAMATRLAVPNVSAETIAELTATEAQLEAAQDDVVEIVRLNARFHELLYAASGRAHLCSVIAMLRHRAAHYFHAYMSELGKYAEDGHRKIIRACKRRDADRFNRADSSRSCDIPGSVRATPSSQPCRTRSTR